MKRVLFILVGWSLLSSLCIQAENNMMSVAVLDLKPVFIDTEIAKSATDLLRTELVNTGYFLVLERSEIEAILEELGFQETGCTDTSCALEIGKVLTTNKIVIGTLTRLDDKLIINIRLVDTEKSTVDYAGKYVLDRESNLIDGCSRLALELTEKAYDIKLPYTRKKAEVKIDRDWIKKGEVCGSVLSVKGKNIVLDIGKNNGVIKGQQYKVVEYVQKEYVSNITGKKNIVSEKRSMGTVKINKVESNSSTGVLWTISTPGDILGKEVIFIGRGRTVGVKAGVSSQAGPSGLVRAYFISYEFENVVFRFIKSCEVLDMVADRGLDPPYDGYDLSYQLDQFKLLLAYKPWDFLYIGGGFGIGNLVEAPNDIYNPLIGVIKQEGTQTTAFIDLRGSVNIFPNTPYLFIEVGVSLNFGAPYSKFEYINGTWEENITGFRRIVFYSFSVGAGL